MSGGIISRRNFVGNSTSRPIQLSVGGSSAVTHGHPYVNRVKRSGCSLAPAGRVAQSATKFRSDLTRDDDSAVAAARIPRQRATRSTGGVYVRVINLDAAARSQASQPASQPAEMTRNNSQRRISRDFLPPATEGGGLVDLPIPGRNYRSRVSPGRGGRRGPPRYARHRYSFRYFWPRKWHAAFAVRQRPRRGKIPRERVTR